MSEKVLHEFTHDGVVYRIVEDDFCRVQIIATFNGAEIAGLPAAMWTRASLAEILRLSAELSELKRIVGEEHGKLARENEELRELLDGAMSAAEFAGFRAREEGRLEGMREADMLWGLHASDKQFEAVLKRKIAAAERELEGGKKT